VRKEQANLVATRLQFSRNLSSGGLLLVAEVAVALVLTPFIIVKLGAAAYGVWAVMISVIGYMGLIDVGIRGSVGRYVNHYLALQDRRAVSEVVGTANVILTGLAAIAFLAALVLAAFFEQVFAKTPPELLDEVRFSLPLLALGLWLSFVSSVLGNLLAAREATFAINHIMLVMLLLRSAGVVWALHSGHGLDALVVITVSCSAISNGVSLIVTRRVFGAEMPRLLGFSLTRLREMWRFGIASFTARTSATMASDSAPIVGMWVLGPEAVAVYSVAMSLTQYGRRLLDQAGNAIFPSVMKAGAVKDLAALRGLYLRYMNISFAIGSLVFVGLMVFSHSFLGLWVGPAYQSGAVVVAILAFGYLLFAAASTGPLTLAALDRVTLTMKIGVAEALACVVLTAALPMLGLGIAGMALGATLPRLVTSCLVYPSLMGGVLGADFGIDMRRCLRVNLLICALVAASFAAVWVMLPGHSWPTLIAAATLVTVLHVAVLGRRYEAFDSVVAGLRAHWSRWRGQGAA
jgi:O-antigen/teichoic acid export membrane protein